MSRLRSLSPRAIAAIAAAAGLAAVLLVFVKVMSHSDYRETGTNSVVDPTHAEVRPGQRICAAHQFAPAESGSVAPWAGGPHGGPGGPLEITVSSRGRTVATARSPESYPTGINRFTLRPVIAHDVPEATVCFRNLSHKAINLYGDWVPPGREQDRSYAGGQALVRLDWYTPDRRPWWRVVPWVADRFPLLKAEFLGPWAFWVAVGLLVGLSLAAIARAVREAPR
jgi:hypothetical protein